MKKALEFNELTQNIQPLLENYLLDNIIGSRIDQWKSTPYNFRYLDTLSRIFDVKPKNPCTSVVPLKDGKKEEYKIAIAFNSNSNQHNITDLKKVSGLLQQAIENKNNIAEFMIEALSKSQCYIYCMGKIQEKLKLYETVEINNPLIQETLNEIKQLIMCVNSKTVNAVSKQYEIALTKLDVLLRTDFKSDNESTQLRKEIFDKKTVEMLIRPYQDIQKIIIFSQQTGKQFITWEVVDNPEGAHAELATSSFYFIKHGEKPDYVGVSKLSCYLCDQVLTLDNQVHRGTHSILYVKDYKLPSKYESSVVKEFLTSKLQLHLNHTIFANPGEHILNTTLLNKGIGKLTQFLDFYKLYSQQEEGNLTKLLDIIPSRGDLDQFDDLSSDEGLEGSLLGHIKESCEGIY